MLRHGYNTFTHSTQGPIILAGLTRLITYIGLIKQSAAIWKQVRVWCAGSPSGRAVEKGVMLVL